MVDDARGRTFASLSGAHMRRSEQGEESREIEAVYEWQKVPQMVTSGGILRARGGRGSTPHYSRMGVLALGVTQRVTQPAEFDIRSGGSFGTYSTNQIYY